MQLVFLNVFILVNFFDCISTIPLTALNGTDYMKRGNNTNNKKQKDVLFHDSTSIQQPSNINRYDAVSHVREVKRDQESLKK